MNDTNNRWYVRCVLESESTSVAYLRQFGLFVEPPICKGRRGTACGAVMEERFRRDAPVWRCPVSKCQTFRSMTSANPFFLFFSESKPGRRQIRLVDILQIAWMWCYSGMTINETSDAVGVAKQTISDWFEKCRHVCSTTELLLPKMRGTPEQPIQVDESYFSGRRKYNRGRLAKGDKRSSREYTARTALEIELAEWGSVDPPVHAGGEFAEKPTRRTNYGEQVVGPWVVGLYKSNTEVRFEIVPDRSASTLRQVIARYCEPGSTIVTDEWKGYGGLCGDGFDHLTVNHSRWFINPMNGANTQGIERLWVEGKAVLKRHRRPTTLLQSHLDEVAWRKRHKTSEATLLSCFWQDVCRLETIDRNL